MHLAATNITTASMYLSKNLTANAAGNYANVSARHIYLPIPTKELAVNHALQQNPLW